MKYFAMCALALAAALALPSSAEEKAKKPRLELKATPRMAFSPVTVFLTAEFTGGEDSEDFYCPEIEWDWSDGGKSVHEADCLPYEPGAVVERRFTAEHEFRRAGVYNVKVTFRHAKQSFASNTVRITVRPGLGDPTR